MHMNKTVLNFNKFIKDAEYRTIILTAISGILLFISWTGLLKDVLPFDVALVSVVISGTPIILEVARGLWSSF